MTSLRLRILIRMRPLLRFVKTRILHIPDTPERIARGIAVGVFTAYLPLFGLHIFLALLLAAIVRANKLMALLFIWVANPLTAVFIYYPSYRIGRYILGFFHYTGTIDPEQMEALFEETLSIERFFLEFFTVDLWKQFWMVFTHIGFEMLIGGILLGLIAAHISYRLSLVTIQRFRKRKRRRRLRLRKKPR